MKQFLIICIYILGLLNCSPKIFSQPYSSQVVFLNKDEIGTITVNSKGFGRKENDAIIDAQCNAFNIILFKGIPGTDLNLPLVENENEAKSKNSEYFTKFFKGGGYHNFLKSSTLSEEPVKVKGGKLYSIDLKINYNSLRTDLEQNDIVRKFGF
jgi:hypothetical protein